MTDVQWSGAATSVAPGQAQGVAAGECPNCRRSRGTGAACQFCSQVDGLPLGVCVSSVAKRFGGYLLDALLVVVTLGVGYFIWALIAFKNGQTPAKQILGMRVVSLKRGQTVSWGTMFLREFIAKTVVGFLSVLTLGIINFWLIWDKNNQQLWDKMVDSVVVDARKGDIR